jgi:calcineurin-like phosphoesterase family protein
MNTPKPRIAFASDFHLGHDREFIYKPRGFNSIREHNQWILRGLNAEISYHDTLWYLGDFSLNTTVEQVLELFRRINCNNIFYVWGNHESSTAKIYQEAKKHAYPAISEDVEVYPVSTTYPLTAKNITFLGGVHEATINHQRIVMQHYAPHVWNKSHRGSWALCGHSHGRIKEILPQACVGKVLDVGVDVAINHHGKPFFWFEDIVKIMSQKEIAPTGIKAPDGDHRDLSPEGDQ